MDEYRSGILAADDTTKVRAQMSPIWVYRRGLCTTTSHAAHISHKHKLQMCPDEAFVDLVVTEQRTDIQSTYDITEVGVDMLSQWIQRRDLLTSVCFISHKLHNTSTKYVLKRALDLAKIEYYCNCAECVGYLFRCS